MEKLSLQAQIEQKMQVLKREQQVNKLHDRVQKKQQLRKSYNKPETGLQSVKILENIGVLIRTSATDYSKCLTPSDASQVFCSDFSYWLQNRLATNHSIKYVSDDNILFYVDEKFHKITQKNIIEALPQMASNAGCPVTLMGEEFRKKALAGILEALRKIDPTYDEVEKFLMGETVTI